MFHGDLGIGVRGVSHDEYFDVAGSVLVQCGALLLEDGGIGLEEIGAFHARTARAGSDQQGDITVREGLLQVARRHNLAQQGESTIGQLHLNTAKDLLGSVHGADNIERDEKKRM
jgi:hypothetical protein